MVYYPLSLISPACSAGCALAKAWGAIERVNIIMSMQPPEDAPDSAPPAFTGSPSRPLNNGQPVSNTNWGRRTGPLSRSLSTPPDLRRYSTTPRYDLAAISDLVGVRAMMLWTWEQNLGISTPDDAPTGGVRYSERDMIALAWLREQILEGVDPAVAAKILREAQQALANDPAQSVPPHQPARSMPLNPVHPQSGPVSSLNPSRPLTPRSMRGPHDPPSQPISRVNASRPLPENMGSPSAPIGGQRPPTRSLPEGGQVINQTWVGPLPNRDLRVMIHPLLNAFTRLDVHTVSRILDDAFMNPNATQEHVCAALITPLIARINEVWVRNDEILPPGLFAINMLRGRLSRFFDQLIENRDAPLTFIATGPSEPHDLDALMLALFWRRMGLRVVYFGATITGQGLMAEVRHHRPRIVALTLSGTQRLRLVSSVAREIDKMEMPKPSFCLVGAPLARNAELQRKTGGIYLGEDANEATHYVRQVLRLNGTQR